MALKAKKTKVQVGFGKKENKTEKTMARLQLAQLVSLDELAENINDKTAVPVPTAKMVLEYLPEAIAQFVRLGHGVDVGFGILKPSISTGAYDDPSKVEVKKKRFTFRIKSKLREILDRLSVSIIGDETVDVDDDESLTPDPSPTGEGSSNSDSSDSGTNQGGGTNTPGGDNGNEGE
jgi:hypothetical protein